MSEHSSRPRDWKAIREKVIGLGDESFRKSYYPELQQRLAELEESETQFRTIFDSVGDSIFLHDSKTGAILSVNQRVCESWGYTREELLGLDVAALSATDTGFTQERALDLIHSAAAGHPEVVEWQARDRNGRLFWMDTRIESAVIGGDHVVLVVARDISARKAAQAALEESEAQLRMLINAMPDIVCFKDGEGRWLEANELLLNLFQLTGVDYRGKTGSELAEYCDFYRDAVLASVTGDEIVWQSGKMFRGDQVIPTPYGDTMTFDIIIVPTYHPDGGRKGLVMIGRDITARKRIEEQQRALEEHKRKFYRDTILSVTDGKLEICEAADTAPFLADASLCIRVSEPVHAREARIRAQSVFALEDDQLGDFAVAAGEAISNMLKHATGGHVYAGKKDGEVWIAVQDNGPGIESIVLPSAVLRRGFSTKPSMGLGYSIMLAASDRILLQTSEEGTTVVLIKDTSPKDPATASMDQWPAELSLSL